MYSGSRFLLVFGSLAFLTAPALAQTSVKGGVYSDAQAKRGAEISGEECARCHSVSLLGGENDTPPLVGEIFQNKWNGLTLADLYEKTRATMPADSPGRLSKSDYVDVLAFILSSNKYPAGAADLKPDPESLKQIKLEP
jgi:mono/diheme cytochrome c family protein